MLWEITNKEAKVPSLHHHEHLLHEYAAAGDEELAKYALELNQMRENTEVPRQLGVIARLLEHIEFEVRCRMAGSSK